MKTLITLTIALTTLAGGATAFAQDYRHNDHRSYRIAYESRDRGDRLEWRINHLNRMLEHVRWEARRYRADWRVRREIQDISRDVERVTRRYRAGDYNGFRIRGEIDRLRGRLHAVEERLHARSGDFYRWN